MNKNLNFAIQKINILEENDKSFLKVEFYAIAEGLCRNDVIFTLDGMEKSLATFYNKPILAAFNKNTNEFEGHNDLGIRLDIENGVEYIDYDSGLLDGIAEKGIGVIPSESNVRIEEYEGKKWIIFDALIWTKYNYKAVKLLNELNKERVSVEITLTDYKIDDETEVITANEFIFDGVTIIGIPEGIEGAHLKVGQFAQSESFNKYQQALMFAYKENKDKGVNDKPPKDNENDKNISRKGDNQDMKFDFKGMGLNTFREKIENSLRDFTYEDDYGWSCRKYWVADLFPDENIVILEDIEDKKLFKIPFFINDERKVIVEIDKREEVEVGYIATNYGIKVDFESHKVKLEKLNGNKEKEEQMELKFREQFVEKDYTPICKYDKYVLFTKKDEEGKLYKLEFDFIDKCEDEKFDEVFTQLSLFDFVENTKLENETVKKEEFELVKAEKDELEKKFSETQEELNVKNEQLSNVEKELNEQKEKYVTLESELTSVKEKVVETEFARFKLKSEKSIKEIADEFGEGKDAFIKDVFAKIDAKEVTNDDELDNYIGQLLLKQTKEKKNKRSQFGITPPDTISQNDAKSKLIENA